MYVSARRREFRLDPRPTTEEASCDQAAGSNEHDDHRILLPKLSRLRQKLGQKAKQEPKFRFYTLYGRIFDFETLWSAWRLVRAKDGAPGVDGVTIDQIDRDERSFLNSLQAELREKRYCPQPVRRVYIPKSNGGKRPLGIPTVKDRVVQTATLLVLEPIFEADFLDCSFGFRPGRSAHQAVDVIGEHLEAGYRVVYDADLSGYFDSIPHDKLMACLEMRISDRSVLKLIRMWLEAPVLEENEDGKRTGHRPRRGTPQGGVISPLLANLYLHWFDKRLHAADGPGRWADAKLVRYADDFVVLARFQGDRLGAWIESTLEDGMGLEINREKTSVVNLHAPGTSLDFLGFTFRYDRDRFGGTHRYLNVFASKQALARERAALRSMTDKTCCHVPLPELIGRLNRHLRGWANYFGHGYPRVAFRQINSYVRLRLSCHLRHRSQRAFRTPEGVTLYAHLDRLGLVYL